MLPELLIGAALFAPPPAPQPPRSVLLVTFDTTRADHVGAYGSKLGATPALDRLAQRGVLFEQAYSPVPMTLPAHASLMTGLLPRNHGARDNEFSRLGSQPTTLAERFQRAGRQTAAVIASVVLDRDSGIARGFDLYDDGVRSGSRRWFDWRERSAQQVNRAVERLLPQLRPPFFLWVHYYDPHLPYVPPSPQRERFQADPYSGEIAAADAAFAELLALLERSGNGNDLIVVAAGDHGESLGEHGEAQHGLFLYQSTTRVPLIVAAPGVKPGRRVKEAVSLIDLAPTLLEMTGLAAPGRSDGRSLRPLIEGGASPDRDLEFETLYPKTAFGFAPLNALLSGPYKVIRAPRPELYDLRRDPAEKHDIATEKPRLVRELLQRLPAFPPQQTAGSEVDPERAEQLRSLGYVAAPRLSGAAPEIDPKDGMIAVQQLEAARKLIADGRAVEAIAQLEPQVAASTRNLQLQIALGTALLSAGRADQAASRFEQALQLAPEDAQLWFLRGNALRADGKREAAVAAFRRSLELQPRHADAVLTLSLSLLELGRPTEAERLLDEAASRRLEDPDLLALRGSLALEAGDRSLAERSFQRALELDPDHPPARRGLARLQALPKKQP